MSEPSRRTSPLNLAQIAKPWHHELIKWFSSATKFWVAYFVPVYNSYTNSPETERLSAMLGRTNLGLFPFGSRNARSHVSADQNFADTATWASMGHRRMHPKPLVEISA